MWEMSNPGGEAEKCFLRAPQTEYYATKERNPDLLSFSPSVRRKSCGVAELAYFCSVSTARTFSICKRARSHLRCILFRT